MMEITDYINNDYKALPIEEFIGSVQDFFVNVTAFTVFSQSQKKTSMVFRREEKPKK